MATSAPTAVDYSKILRQVEFYFSDQSLRKDKFMNEKIAENVEGAVSLDVLLTFNRLKTLTTDKSVVIEALKPSTFLEVVNDNMVKRSDPFNSENVKDALPATIYVENLGQGMDIDQVAPLFSTFGTVKLIHIFKSFHGSKDKTKVPSGNAFIEFSAPEEAQAALAAVVLRDATKFYAKIVQEGDFDFKLVRGMMKADYKLMLDETQKKNKKPVKGKERELKERPDIVDCLVEVSNLLPSETLDSFSLKSLLKEIITPRFVDYEKDKNNTKAIVRFLTAEEANVFMKGVADKKFAVEGSEVAVRLLDAKEQEEYFKLIRSLPKSDDKPRGGRGRARGRGRGGRGGRERRDRSKSPRQATEESRF